MIFVTVGTHEQQFNRLVSEVDRLRRGKFIEDEVIIQRGFGTYVPEFCEWKRLYPYQQMLQCVGEARIVITHGGPSSFIMPLQLGKAPIVVPRQKQFGEHVNDHQVEFCRVIAERQRNILVVEEIKELKEYILHYDELIAELDIGKDSNNVRFMEEFQVMVKAMMGRG